MALLVIPQAMIPPSALEDIHNALVQHGGQPVPAGWANNPQPHGDGWIFDHHFSDHHIRLIHQVFSNYGYPWVELHTRERAISFWPVVWHLYEPQEDGSTRAQKHQCVYDQARRAGWFSEHVYHHHPTAHQVLRMKATDEHKRAFPGIPR